MIDDRLRQGLLRKSAKNRRFFDHLCLLIWCECKANCATKSQNWEKWCDIELNYYGVSKDATIDEGVGCFNTPRKVLAEKELDAIQDFINTHTFHSLTQAKREIADDLFNDCVACGLNVLQDVYDEGLSRIDYRKLEDKWKKKEEKGQTVPISTSFQYKLEF